MEYTKLGNTGMDVSRICLGCMGFGDAEHWVHKWVLNEENSRPVIQKALELGINFIDTANAYGIFTASGDTSHLHLGLTEEIIGRWLAQGGRRERIVLATKVFVKMGEGVNEQGL